MKHKKANHLQAVPNCRKFMKGNCNFDNNQCWYSHSETFDSSEKGNNSNESQVFQKGQEISQPPDLIMRLFSMMEKMVVKVDNLEKVSKMKN